MGSTRKTCTRTRLTRLGKACSAFVLFFFSLSIIGGTAYIFEQASQTVTQNIINVVNLNLENSDLGSINEGETRVYSKEVVPSLGDSITITVDDSVYFVDVNLDSNLDEVSDYYSVYDVTVRFSQVVGESYSVGDVACVLSIGSDDYSSIELDGAGTWKFDLEVIVTAKSVDVDTNSAVTIIVSVEEV